MTHGFRLSPKTWFTGVVVTVVVMSTATIIVVAAAAPTVAAYQLLYLMDGMRMAQCL